MRLWLGAVLLAAAGSGLVTAAPPAALQPATASAALAALQAATGGSQPLEDGGGLARAFYERTASALAAARPAALRLAALRLRRTLRRTQRALAALATDYRSVTARDVVYDAHIEPSKVTCLTLGTAFEVCTYENVCVNLPRVEGEPGFGDGMDTDRTIYLHGHAPLGEPAPGATWETQEPLAPRIPAVPPDPAVPPSMWDTPVRPDLLKYPDAPAHAWPGGERKDERLYHDTYSDAHELAPALRPLLRTRREERARASRRVMPGLDVSTDAPQAANGWDIWMASPVYPFGTENLERFVGRFSHMMPISLASAGMRALPASPLDSVPLEWGGNWQGTSTWLDSMWIVNAITGDNIAELASTAHDPLITAAWYNASLDLRLPPVENVYSDYQAPNWAGNAWYGPRGFGRYFEGVWNATLPYVAALSRGDARGPPGRGAARRAAASAGSVRDRYVGREAGQLENDWQWGPAAAAAADAAAAAALSAGSTTSVSRPGTPWDAFPGNGSLIQFTIDAIAACCNGLVVKRPGTLAERAANPRLPPECLASLQSCMQARRAPLPPRAAWMRPTYPGVRHLYTEQDVPKPARLADVLAYLGVADAPDPRETSMPASLRGHIAGGPDSLPTPYENNPDLQPPSGHPLIPKKGGLGAVFGELKPDDPLPYPVASRVNTLKRHRVCVTKLAIAGRLVNYLPSGELERETIRRFFAQDSGLAPVRHGDMAGSPVPPAAAVAAAAGAPLPQNSAPPTEEQVAFARDVAAHALAADAVLVDTAPRGVNLSLPVGRSAPFWTLYPSLHPPNGSGIVVSSAGAAARAAVEARGDVGVGASARPEAAAAVSSSPPPRVRVLIVDRTRSPNLARGRYFENLPEVLAMCARYAGAGVRCDVVTEDAFGVATFEWQHALYTQYPLIITPHGSTEINTITAPRRGVVIEVQPRGMWCPTFLKGMGSSDGWGFQLHSRLKPYQERYVPVPINGMAARGWENTYAQELNVTYTNCDAITMVNLPGHMDCWYSLRDQMIRVPLAQLELAFVQALELLGVRVGQAPGPGCLQCLDEGAGGTGEAQEVGDPHTPAWHLCKPAEVCAAFP